MNTHTAINQLNIIYASIMSGNDVFDMSTTGMSMYDNFLNEKDAKYMKYNKKKLGEVVYMSPDEYIKRCAYDIFEKSDLSGTLNAVNNELVDTYANMMKDGTKFPIPVLNYAEHEQEGRHRAMAAKKLGINKIPVLMITNYDINADLGLPDNVSIPYGTWIAVRDENGDYVYNEPIDMHLSINDMTDDLIKDNVKKVINKLKSAGVLSSTLGDK